MVAVVVEGEGLGQVEREVHMGPKEQEQLAHPNRQLLPLGELQTTKPFSYWTNI